MRWLCILAIVLPLAQQPAEAPKDKGAPEANRTHGATHTESATDNQQPPAKSTPSTAQPSIPMKSKTDTVGGDWHAGANNEKTSDEDLRIQRKLALSTVALVVVGILQFFALVGQVIIYCRQAKIMAHQAGEMTRQRVTMRGQLEAMQGQLGQMESAGKQTDRLITHASNQTIALKNAANAASLNAVSAKQAVEIVISKERCRIRMEPPQGLNFPYQSDQVTHEPTFDANHPQAVNYYLYCYGLTEGDITEAIDGACVSDSEEPPTIPGSPISGFPWRIIQTDPEQAWWFGSARMFPRLESMDDITAVIEGRKFIHFWGHLRYRDVFFDVFRQKRITAFRYVWKFTGNPTDVPVGTPLGGRFGAWRKCGPPEDNRQT